MMGNPILMNLKTRLLKRNKNCLILVAGETGSGKSYAAMRIGQMIDPDFSIKNVVFSPMEFMEVLKKPWIKAGSCVVFDEAGVGIPSRDWYTIQNKMVGFVMQTFRHMNLAVIFTVPNISFIDIQLRNLFHMYLEPRSISYKNKTCSLLVFYLRQWPRSERVVPIHPRLRTPDKWSTIGCITRIKAWTVELPHDKIISHYENKKLKFSQKLRTETYNMLNRFEEKKQPEESKTEQCRKLLESGKYKQVEIAGKLDMHAQHVSSISRKLEINKK